MRPSTSLNDDIRLLGRTLGDVIADQAGPATLDLVESIRRAAVGDTDADHLIELLDPLPIADALHVIRAFSYFAMLANIAEDTDHARRRRAAVHSGAPAPAGTLEHSIQLIEDARLDAHEVQHVVGESEVIPVLTAHPTEIRRRTIQSIQTAVAALMAQRDRVDMNRVEEAEWSDELWRQIVTLWQTAMLQLTKLRLRDDVNDAMRYFELSLLSQGPRLNAAVNAALGPRPDRNGRCCVSARGSARSHGTRSSPPTCWPTRSSSKPTSCSDTTFASCGCWPRELSMSSRLVIASPAVIELARRPWATPPYRLDEPYRQALEVGSTPASLPLALSLRSCSEPADRRAAAPRDPLRAARPPRCDRIRPPATRGPGGGQWAPH